MIDITHKQTSLRTALASGEIKLTKETIPKIINNELPKGNLFDIARAAAYLGAKNTASLIPHCHPTPIESLDVKCEVDEAGSRVIVKALAKTIYKTGIEMEAMTAVSIALLTIYDLLKPVDKKMEIGSIKLLEKTGGRSQQMAELKKGLTAAVLVCSDSTAAGKRQDKSGLIIQEMLKTYGVEILAYEIVPDEPEQIQKNIIEWVKKDIAFVFTTGGTGLSPRDQTVDAVKSLFEQEAPGIGEAMRSYGMNMTPKAMHSRSVAGSIQTTLIVCLPGSSAGARESLQAVLPGLFHARSMLKGGGH
ncbi:MAG: bifunctional molybdenum cofactor biosynthesis protein MoaC/MoaB [Spirochaetia bacterium]|nr:bifunctional molybdenum cofactor biosynthesis protein MoaC/MoaB [Spirochaetia bacterium]